MNALINFLNTSDIFLKVLEKSKNIILNSKRIFIVASYELEYIAFILHDYLLLINKPIIYSKYQKWVT